MQKMGSRDSMNPDRQIYSHFQMDNGELLNIAFQTNNILQKYPKPLSSISGFHDCLILHFIEEVTIKYPHW